MWKGINLTVLLISPEGENLGHHDLEEAERIAEERYGLDLVEVREGTYKILDLGKLRYEASKRKQVKAKPIKEMKFKLNIGENDYLTKMQKVLDFLKSGHNVRITIWFSGREVTRPEVGVTMMERIKETVGEWGNVTMNPVLQGKNMTMSIEPVDPITGKRPK